MADQSQSISTDDPLDNPNPAPTPLQATQAQPNPVVEPDQNPPQQPDPNSEYNSYLNKVREQDSVLDPNAPPGVTGAPALISKKDSPEQFEKAAQNYTLFHFKNINEQANRLKSEEEDKARADVMHKVQHNDQMAKIGLAPQYQVSPEELALVQKPGEAAPDIKAPTLGAGPAPESGTGLSDEYSKAMAESNSAQQGALKEQGQAIQNQGAIQANKYADEAAIQQQKSRYLQDQKTNIENHYKDFENESNNAIKDIKEGHINPGHYMESMGVFDRVRIAIGMVIAGAGAGALRQENPVSKFIYDQIDKDIEAQREKPKTIYNAILSKEKDRQVADSQSRAMQMDIYASMIGDIAAKSNSAEAPQIAAQLIAPLKQKAAMLRGEAATEKAMMGPGGGGLAAMMSPEKQKQWVPGQGFAVGDATKYKEELVPTAKSIVGGLDQLIDIANTPGSSITPKQLSLAKEITTELKGQYAKQLFSRTTENEIKMLDDVIKNPTNLFSLKSSNINVLNDLRTKVEKDLGNHAQGLQLLPLKFPRKAYAVPGKKG